MLGGEPLESVVAKENFIIVDETDGIELETFETTVNLTRDTVSVILDPENPYGSEHVISLTIKKDFQDLEIIINGGFTSTQQVIEHLNKVDGAMIGRAVYHSPYLLADIENKIFKNTNVPTREEIIEKLIFYIKNEIKKGTRINQVMRHTLGLFHGQTGASFWKKYLRKFIFEKYSQKACDYIFNYHLSTENSFKLK